MSRAMVAGVRVLLFLLASVAVANLFHRVVFPIDPPDPATYPRAGDIFGSVAEGITQQVVTVRDGWVVLRSQVAPRAPGPPMHFHRSFAEVFTVESGRLHVELPDGAIQLGPGQEQRVEPGVSHRLYNPTDEEVTIAGDKPAMPQSFAACLVQIYHFLVQLQGTSLGKTIPSPLWGEGQGEGHGMRFDPPSPPSSPASGRGGKADSQTGWLFLH